MDSSLLQVERACVRFGGVVALDEVDLTVAAGEAIGVVGALGAGKTTLLAVAAGRLRLTSGTVRLDGDSLAGLAPGEPARRGVFLVPAGGGVFPSLTVRENLELASDGEFPSPAVEGLFVRFPVLAGRQRQVAGSLSGGEQRQLAIARAALSLPRVLLLDEPLLGLAPQVAEAVAALLRTLAGAGCAIVIAEERPSPLLTAITSRLVGLRLGRLADAEDLRVSTPAPVRGEARSHQRVEPQTVRVPLTVAEKRHLQTIAAAGGETVGELIARLVRDHPQVEPAEAVG